MAEEEDKNEIICLSDDTVVCMTAQLEHLTCV